MDVQQVADIIKNISDGFENACAQCLSDNSGIVVMAIQEQLYSGQSGTGEFLSPTYDNDPWFDVKGTPWYHRALDYKQWKEEETPPTAGSMIGLPPRPVEVPNLFIDGTFHSEITASLQGDVLLTDPGNGNGPEIVEKYGDEILTLGPSAVEFFNLNYMLPAIGRHFENCGYR